MVSQINRENAQLYTNIEKAHSTESSGTVEMMGSKVLAILEFPASSVPLF